MFLVYKGWTPAFGYGAGEEKGGVADRAPVGDVEEEGTRIETCAPSRRRTHTRAKALFYTLTLTVHSWVRWALVLVATVAFARSGYAFLRGREYAGADGNLAKWFIGLLNLQFTLGLVLYIFLSPTVRAALSDLGAAMGSAPLRFFVVEHQVAAIIAVGMGYAGVGRARKATESRKKHRAIALGAGGCLFMILFAIPWPFLPYGRALFRFF